MSVFRSVVGRLIYALIFLRFIKIFTFVFPKNGVQTADDEKNNRELHAGSSSEVENNKQNKTRKDWKYRTQWLNIINEKIESRSRAVQTELLDDVDLDDNSGTTADENPDGFDDDDSAGDRDDAKIDRQVVKSHRCINKAPEKLLPLPSITPSSSSSSVEKKISGGAHATPTNSKNNGWFDITFCLFAFR
jgi:hypothetical protein